MRVDYAQTGQIGSPWNAAPCHRAGNRGDQNFQERKGGVQDLGPLACRVGKRGGVGESELWKRGQSMNLCGKGVSP